MQEKSACRWNLIPSSAIGSCDGFVDRSVACFNLHHGIDSFNAVIEGIRGSRLEQDYCGRYGSQQVRLLASRELKLTCQWFWAGYLPPTFVQPVVAF